MGQSRLDDILSIEPSAPPDYRALVRSSATAAGLDPDLVGRLVDAESAFNPAARSPKGAIGLMQLMPGTAKRFGVNPNDPEDNIKGGIAYLSWLHSRYGGNTTKAVAAYNAGEGAVDKYQGVPPFKETRDYVAKIIGAGTATLDDIAEVEQPTTQTGSLSDIEEVETVKAGGVTDPRSVKVTNPPAPRVPAAGRGTGLDVAKADASIFSEPFKGIGQAVAGARDAVTSLFTPPSQRATKIAPEQENALATAGEMQPTPLPTATKAALSDVSEGLMKAGSPTVVAALAAAPVMTAIGFGAATAAAEAARKATAAAGGDAESQRLAGNVAAMLAAGVASDKILRVIKRGATLTGEASATAAAATGKVARNVAVATKLRMSPPAMEAAQVAKVGIHAPIEAIDTGVATSHEVSNPGAAPPETILEALQDSPAADALRNVARKLRPRAPGTAEAPAARVENLADIGGAGKAIADNLYVRIWEDVKAGKVDPKTAPLAEQIVKAAHERGLITSLDDVKRFARMTLTEARAAFPAPQAPAAPVDATRPAEAPSPASLPGASTSVPESSGGAPAARHLDGPRLRPFGDLPEGVRNIFRDPSLPERRGTDERRQTEQEVDVERRTLTRRAVVDVSPPKEERDEHKLSSTQVNLPETTAKHVIALARAIPDEDIAEDGRAGDSEGSAPHVTVKYGLHTTDVDTVRKVLAQQPPVTVKLGTSSLFENEKSDVLKIDVDSPDLHRLNAALSKALKNTDTHPTYQPHVTIAYLKPGRGKAYAGDDSLKGHTVTLDTLRFSTKDGQLFDIPLEGQAITAEFLGWQEGAEETDPHMPLYNVKGGELDGSTVTKETLEKHGIAIPETPAQTTRPSGDVATTPQLALRLNDGKTVLHVSSLEEAARHVDALVNQHEETTGEGASSFPTTFVIDVATGKPVARISYNGRIWDARSGKEIERPDGRGYGKPAPISTTAAPTKKPVAMPSADEFDEADRKAITEMVEAATTPTRAEFFGIYMPQLLLNHNKGLYGWPRENVGTVAARMATALQDGSANIDSPALKATAKALGFKNIRAAWKAYFAGESQPVEKKPVTPQVPNEPGTKYVLPSFATAQYQKPQAEAQTPNPKSQGEEPEWVRDIRERLRDQSLGAFGIGDVKPGHKVVTQDEWQKVLDYEAQQAQNAPSGRAESDSLDGGRSGGAGDVSEPAERPGDARARDVAGEQPAVEEGVSGELDQPEGGRKQRPARRRPSPRSGTAAPRAGDDLGGSAIADAASHVDTADLADSGVVAAAEARGERPRHFSIANAEALTEGGATAKLDDNLAAIRLLKALESERRLATDAEQQILARYVGWGHTGLAPVVDLIDTRVRERDPRLQKARADLEALLSKDEIRELGESTPNAHYSFSDLPRAMWAAIERLGFKGGVVLEPAVGTGHFLGTMPPAILGHKRTRVWGIDKEPIAAGIAKHLYQDAHIQNRPIQEANLPNDYFDVVISNVPFGRIQIFDPQFTSSERRPLTTAIHNYYFGKALDVTRPGGLIAFVTSRYTMDSRADSVRAYLAQRASLLGAIRLPDSAFRKTAGTDVVTDVLFFQKRQPSSVRPAPDDAWVETKAHERLSEKNYKGAIVRGVHTNVYFQEHPEQILGTETLSGKMARTTEPQYNVEGTVDYARLVDALARVLPEGLYKPSKAAPRKVAKDAAVDAKQGAFQLEGGKLYLYDRGTLVPSDLKGKALERAKAFIPIRDAYQQVLDVMLARGTDADLATAQAGLKKTYDAFVKRFGHVNTRENRQTIERDPNGGRVVALENIEIVREVKGRPARVTVTGLAPIFSKRTIAPPVEPTTAASPLDALTQSLAWKGRVDIDYMQALMGQSADEIATALEGRIYRDPVTRTWEAADEYLSGDVTTKLAQAKAAADLDGDYAANVPALERVQPRPLTPEEFSVPFGATYVPIDLYATFIKAEAGAKVDIRLLNSENRVRFYVEGYGQHEFLPAGMEFASWVADALNSDLPTIKVKTPGGGEAVDQEATQAYRESLKQLRERWAEWWPTEPAATDQLTKIYNGMFNRETPYVADGSHLVLPNASPLIQFRPWQKNVVWRAIQSGNVLAAHAVGAGKTYEMDAIAGEWKRLGLASKPMIVVPNTLIEQARRDFLALYPAARILVPGKDDFKAANRRRFIASVANNDWDAIIIAASQFLRVSVKLDTLKAFIKEQEDQLLADGAAQMNQTIEDFNDLVTEYGAGAKDAIRAFSQRSGTPKSVKDIARTILSLRARLQKRIDQSKKDAPVSFEELGVDGLLIDEAHLYKNLFFSTAKNNIAGLTPSNADRAMDMFLKVRLINKASNSRRVGFFTGTPVSNAMSEIYTMFRYLASETLDRLGMAGFDSWANANAEPEARSEPAPGGGYKERIRLRKWTNLRELSSLFRRFADVVTTEDLKKSVNADGTPYLRLPPLKNGRPTTIALEPHPQMEAFMAELRDRIEAIRSGKVDPKEDNHLKITGEAGYAAIDLRLVMPGAEADPNSRINVAAREIAKRYKAPPMERATQLVFLDVGVPDKKSMPPLPASVVGGPRVELAGEEAAEDDEDGTTDDLVDEEAETDKAIEGFQRMAFAQDLYTELRNRLVDAGVKNDEIAYVQQAQTPYELARLFDAVNDGRIRVLIASTSKGGIGMNVQKRLHALHHLDVPWRPADMEQREGRAIRQLNENDEVEILRYVTKRSFDEYRWGVLSDKQGMISSFLKGELTTMEDIDPAQLDMQVAQALASGDPRTLEMLNKEREVKGLQTRYTTYARRINQAKRAITAGKDAIDALDARLPVVQQAGQTARIWEQHPDITLTVNKGRFYGLSEGKERTFDWKDTDARKAFQEAIEQLLESEPYLEEQEIGYVDGFRKLVLYRSEFTQIKASVLETVRSYALSVVIPSANVPHGRLTLGTTPGWSKGEKFPDFRRSLDAITLTARVDAEVERITKALEDRHEEVRRNTEIAAKPFQQGDLLAEREADLKALKEALGMERKAATKGDRLEEALVTEQEPSQGDVGKRGESRGDVKKPGGGTTLQMAIIPGAKEFLEGDVVPSLQEVAEKVQETRRSLKMLFAPDTVSASAERMAGIMRANLAAQWQRTQRARQVMAEASKALDRLYAGAQKPGEARERFLRFTDAMEGVGRIQDLTPAERAIAAWARDALDTKRGQVQKHGKLEDYIENYFPHEWKRPSAVGDAIRRLFGKRPLQGPASFLKQRKIPTIREGVEAGLEPVAWNPVELTLRKLYEMDKWITAKQILKEAKAANIAVFQRPGRKAPEGFVPYPESFGQVYGPPPPDGFGLRIVGRYYGPADAVRILSNYLSPGLRGKSALYDLYRVAGNFLNQLQLSLSAFHAMTTGLESIVSKQAIAFEQFTRGNFTKAAKAQVQVPAAVLIDLVRGHKALRAFYAKDANARAVDDMIHQIVQAGGGFGWDLFEHTGAPQAFLQALRQGNYPGALVRLIPAAIEMQAKPIMDWWVPRLKIAAFLDRAAMELETLGAKPTLEETRRVLGQAWDSIDNRFGELRYDNLFWHNVLKDVGMGSTRALGWNVGSLREMFGAPGGQLARMGLATSAGGRGGFGKRPTRKVNTGRDAAGQRVYDDVKEPLLHPKMAWFLSMAVIAGVLGAIYQYLHTGTAPEDLKDYYFPRNGRKNADGTDERVSLPGYAKDAYAWVKQPLTTAEHKLNPLLTLLWETFTNKDFFGVEIRNADDALVQQAKDWATYVAQTFKPLSFARYEQDSSTENALGINRAPGYVTRTAAEERLKDIMDKRGRPTLSKQAAERRQLRTQYRQGLAAGTPEGRASASEAVASGQLTRRQLRRGAQDAGKTYIQRTFPTLTLDEAIDVYERATPAERRQVFTELYRKRSRFSRQTPGAAATLQRFNTVARLPRQ